MNDYIRPADPHAEEAVIGSILIDPDAYADVAWLTSKMFTEPRWARTWQAMVDLAKEGIRPDIVTVQDKMAAADEEDTVMLYQTERSTPTSTGIRHYADIVLRKYQQWGMIVAAHQLLKDAYADTDPRQSGQNSLMRVSKVLALSPDQAAARIPYPTILDRLYEDVYERQVDRMRNPTNPHLSFLTGFPAIDRWTGGFEKGDLVLIAARPAVGKSALGLSLARRIAARYHAIGSSTVDYVTFEMAAIAQARRIIGNNAGIDTLDMRKGFVEVDDIDMQTYATFLSAIEQEKQNVGESLGFFEHLMTTDQLAVHATAGVVNNGLRFLIIDQLNLFTDTHREGERMRMATMSRALKLLAMRLGIVIICLVQISRKAEERNDHRPQLADLKESGDLEANADIVLGIYRPAAYYPIPEHGAAAFGEWSELLTLKYRNGMPNIMTPLAFKHGYFTDWDDAARPITDMLPIIKQAER